MHIFRKPTVADLCQAAKQLGMNPGDGCVHAVEEIITLLGNAYGCAPGADVHAKLAQSNVWLDAVVRGTRRRE